MDTHDRIKRLEAALNIPDPNPLSIPPSIDFQSWLYMSVACALISIVVALYMCLHRTDYTKTDITIALLCGFVMTPLVLSSSW